MREISIGLIVLCCVGVAEANPSEASKELATTVQDQYLAKQRDAAHTLMTGTRNAAPWATHSGVTVSAVFHSRARGLTLEVERKPGVKGDLVVAIAPGTWAKPDPDDDDPRDDGPYPQDLILVRAPVVVIAASQDTGSVTVPVFCASYRRKGPKPGVSYALKTAAPGSNLDALAQVLCALSELPSHNDDEIAVAVWVAHENMSYRKALGMNSFRVPRQRTTEATRAGAEALIRSANIETSELRYFQEAPRSARSKSDSKAKAKPAKKAKPKPVRKAKPQVEG